MTEAVVSDIDDVEVTRVSHNGEYATFSLRHWKGQEGDALGRSWGGSLTVASSFGTWSYTWCPGKPFKEFVVTGLAKDWHYTMKKLVGEDGIRGFSLDKTLDAARERLLYKRRQDGISADREVAAEAKRTRNREGGYARYSTADIDRLCTKALAAEAWEDLNNCNTETEVHDVLLNNRFIPVWGYEGYEYLRTDYHEWISRFWKDLFLPYAAHLAEKIK